MDYSKIKTTSRFDQYKKFLGGGAKNWEHRGKFQLDLMKLVGLLPNNTFVDIGCGPGRGDVHFINYLNKGKYFGFDYNKDFISIFQKTVVKKKLVKKHSTIECANNFLPSFFKIQNFDYALAFSVLNHANYAQKINFFRNIEFALIREGRVIVTHGNWLLNNSKIFKSNLRLLRIIDSNLIDSQKYGWSETENPYPILEFGI